MKEQTILLSYQLTQLIAYITFLNAQIIFFTELDLFVWTELVLEKHYIRKNINAQILSLKYHSGGVNDLVTTVLKHLTLG